MEAFIGGAWRTISRGEAYVGGQWRSLKRGEAYRSGGWNGIASFVPPIIVSVSPTSIDGNSSPPTPQTMPVITGFVTATPIGGTPPYTYLWSCTDSVNVNYPTNASTSFGRSVPAETSINATATVTVTDANGNPAQAACAVNLSNYSFA